LSKLVKRLLNFKELTEYLEVLKDRNLLKGTLYQEDSEGISLSDILIDATEFAKEVTRDLKNNSYQFGMARIKTIKAGDKEREVFAYTHIDTVIAGFMSYLMSEILEELYSENLYSYRKNKSYWIPVQNFSTYIREYRNKTPNPKDRALFVARRDIKSYTDSIPLGENSPIWKMIKTAFISSEDPPYFFNLIKDIIRNTVENNGAPFSIYKGIPTGQPITAILYNFYVMELDEYFDSHKLFYTRYSDDLIFCTDDPNFIKKHIIESNKILSNLGLTFKEEKAGDFYFNGAGRPCPDPYFQGVEHIDYLGFRINFNATTSLKSGRYRRLLSELRNNIQRITKELNESNIDIAGRYICNFLNQTFWSQNSMLEFKSINILQKAITDRDQLKNFDYDLAKIISETLTGIRGVKAFRKVEYKTIREQWGLKSFEHMRNIYGRR
jgi:hypothetical protein